MVCFPFDLPGFKITEVKKTPCKITIVARAFRRSGNCPSCGQPSSRVHSYYTRRPSDLPFSEYVVDLRLQVRRFRCPVADCQQRVFAERFPELLLANARRTTRLTRSLRAVGLVLGGESAARVLGLLRMPATPDTLLRIIRHASPIMDEEPPPRVLGVDDWAFCKGRCYGTILVDLERHRPVDLLPDRTADTLSLWLKARPGIEIVARDRSTEYARGITEGAPEALQVADRWHLLKNLREVIQRLLRSKHAELRALPEVGDTVQTPAVRRGRFWRTEAEEQLTRVHRKERLARYQQIRRLREKGGTITGIARQLGMSRGGVRRYFYAETFPERTPRHRPPSILDPYLDYLEQRHQEGCVNASKLWREIQAQGFPGTYRQVARWTGNNRIRPARNSPTGQLPRRYEDPGSSTEKKAPLPSARELSWLVIRASEESNETEVGILKRIRQASWMDNVYRLAQQFRRMIRDRLADELDEWILEAKATGLRRIINFASGLQQDYRAVRAALETEWSSGQIEGQINRLKLLKRQMYGRASFDLLRIRVLEAA